jgi:hypothetical protein
MQEENPMGLKTRNAGISDTNHRTCSDISIMRPDLSSTCYELYEHRCAQISSPTKLSIKLGRNHYNNIFILNEKIAMVQNQTFARSVRCLALRNANQDIVQGYVNAYLGTLGYFARNDPLNLQS